MSLLRNLIALSLFIGILSIVGFILKDDIKEITEPFSLIKENISAPQVRSFPSDETFSNKDGTELQIRLTARNHEFIQFIRISDEKTFIFPIEDLDPASQAIALSYPNIGLKDSADYLSDKTLSLEQVHIESLREQIGKWNDQVEKLQAKLELTESQSAQRSLLRDIKLIQTKIAGLESDIIERNSLALSDESEM